MSIARLSNSDLSYLDGLVPSVYPDTLPTTGGAFTLTNSGANVPGPWVEVIAAAAIAVPFVLVGFSSMQTSVNNVNAKIDVASGAGGSEVLRGSAAFYLNTNTGLSLPQVMLVKPVLMAANSRVAARKTSETTNTFTVYLPIFYPLA